MKWLKNGNLAKLVAFFVIAVTITCTVSFAANGWQSFITEKPDSDDVTADNNSENNNVDENTDGDKNNSNDITTSVPVPKYYHYITGLETDLETSLKRPLCTVFNSGDPTYGISASYLTIELPTEYGKTRLLCFTDDVRSIGKIGSIAPTRGYISNLASYFGGILLSYGNDDMFEYEHTAPSYSLDFKETSGYSYTEYNSFIYTNGDLVNAFITNSKANILNNGSVNLPYVFKDKEDGSVDDKKATNISVTYSDNNITEFAYSKNDNKYLISKNGVQQKDLLNDKTTSYDNVFILSADSATYETESNTEMILDTSKGGNGKYISRGAVIDISWSTDASGNILFHDLSGNKLAINRGTSYISFVKASASSSVKIS